MSAAFGLIVLERWDKDSKVLAHPFKGAFFNAADVGARDLHGIRYLALCHSGGFAESVSQNDHASFALVKHLVDQPICALGVDLEVEVFVDVVIRTDHVDVCKRIAVTIYVDGFIDRNLAGQLFL